MKLKPYPEYKPSGSQWLGEVPAHWQVKKLRTLVTPRSERNQAELPLLSVAREKGVFVRSLVGGDDNYNVIPEDLSNYKVARKGDLVINKMKAWQGSMGIAPCDGIVSPAYFVFDFQIANQSFGQALIRSKPYVAHFAQASDGVRIGQWDLSMAGMREIPILVPTDDEQVNIACFLDRVNKRIERLILAKNRMIALLNEQKQAIIQRAVTRGLDPNMRPKPSGVDWIGEMPAHWEVVRVKYLLKEVDERSTTGQERLLSLRMNHGLVPHDEHFKRPGQASSLVGYKLVRPGQVVMNRLQANNGLTFSSELFGAISPDYAVFKPIADLDTNYLTTLFRTPRMKHKFRVEAKGLGTGTSGFLRLYSDRFGTIPVALPPRKEQTQIMSALQDSLDGNQRSTKRVESEVKFLLEYRTRLIADVVTGKLDVREVELREMDELEELEALDSAGNIEADALDETEELAYADD